MRKLSFVAGSLCAFAACQQADAPPPVVESAPIVNGQTENGYPAIGALTSMDDEYYYGSFCTATLIAPQWLITAAHCLEGLSASETFFYSGTNANDPDFDDMRAVSQLIPHEQYDDDEYDNDIALVKLSAPLGSVAPIVHNVASLTAYEGDSAFTVGYGLTTGLNENTGGIKRSTNTEITDVRTYDYWSAYTGTGTCFGDSGGPSMVTIDGALKVVGITSSGPACSGPNCDPCKTGTFNTRVDAYKAWITSKIGGTPLDCNDDTSMCLCAQACQANGVCNDALCPAEDDCVEGFECWVECEDQSCANACAAQVAPGERPTYNALVGCVDDCWQSSETQNQFDACVNANCGDAYEGCYGPAPAGDSTCSEVNDCIGECDSDACSEACFADGTSVAQAEFNAMWACIGENCQSAQDLNACAWTECESFLETCLGGGTGCPDNDADDSCDADDCNDSNDDVYPGRNEVCDNDIDDNCNSQTDEDCTGPNPDPDPTPDTSPNDPDTSNPTNNPTTEPTSPTDPTDPNNPDPDPTTAPPTSQTTAEGNGAVGRSADGCAAGSSEAPLLLLGAVLGLFVLRRRRMLGA